MKLKNLEECIWDAQITRDKLSRSIETILEREKPHIDAIRLVGKAKDDLQRAQTYLLMEKSRFENIVRQRDQLQESLDARKDAVARGIEQRKNTEKHLVEAKIKLVECKEMLKSTAEGITGQQRRVITELQKIYPIEPVSHPSTPLCPLLILTDTGKNACVHYPRITPPKYGVRGSERRNNSGCSRIYCSSRLFTFILPKGVPTIPSSANG